MTIKVEAIYENGVLKPARPLPLDEQQRVHVSIESLDDPLEGVIGICDEGPRISLAEKHDEIVYGPPPGNEKKT